jgi:hypothetical protein
VFELTFQCGPIIVVDEVSGKRDFFPPILFSDKQGVALYLDIFIGFVRINSLQRSKQCV